MLSRVAIVTVASTVVAASCWAQSLQQRIDGLRERRAADEAAARVEAAPIRARLAQVVGDVNLQDRPLRDAIKWYTTFTGVPVVINWRAMEQAGVDPETEVTIRLTNVPAQDLLTLILRMGAPDARLLYETTPWYVQVMTRPQANEQRVTRVYDVADLLMEVPHFDNAPEFDLNNALSNTNSGGSNGRSGGSNQGPFADRERTKEPVRTRSERGEDLAQLVRDTIEPDVWDTMGGQSTIKYFNGRLIVSAPRYVHAQIGMPVLVGEDLGRRNYAMDTPRPRVAPGAGAAEGVAAKQDGPSPPVAAVRD